jgi:hypothetical protein
VSDADAAVARDDGVGLIRNANGAWANERASTSPPRPWLGMSSAPPSSC